jgi:hypothetical protein
MMSKVAPPAFLGRTRFLATVARSSMSVWKLCTGLPFSVRLVWALARALRER